MHTALSHHEKETNQPATDKETLFPTSRTMLAHSDHESMALSGTKGQQKI